MASKEEVISLGEYKVNYAAAGSGTTVILLHGGDSRESWKTWEPLLPLAENHRLVIPDLVGYGSSTRPSEIPDYVEQSKIMRELMERLSIESAVLVGSRWGGQVALQVAIDEPRKVEAMVLISSTYDKSQLLKLKGPGRPTLILWAEDDLVTQLKAGYLLRDAVGTSRLEVLGPVANDPRFDFTASHRLEKFRSEALLRKISDFLSAPRARISEPPSLEPELRGMALSESGRSGNDERKAA